jgi:hypothetical protein
MFYAPQTLYWHANERRPEQLRPSFRGARKSILHCPRPSARVGLRPGRRSCAGHSAGPATHSRAHGGAGHAPDRKRHDTPDRRADAGARHSTGYSARAGIRVPMSIPVVIAGPINRVRAISVIGNRRGFPVGIHPASPPAIAILVAGNIGTFGRLGASYRGGHQGCARNSQKRAHSKGSVKFSHLEPFFAFSPFDRFPVPNKRSEK